MQNEVKDPSMSPFNHILMKNISQMILKRPDEDEYKTSESKLNEHFNFFTSRNLNKRFVTEECGL